MEAAQLSSATRRVPRWQHATDFATELQTLSYCTEHRMGCVVYSFGSNNDFSFEEAVLAQDERCKIHTFDHG